MEQKVSLEVSPITMMRIRNMMRIQGFDDTEEVLNEALFRMEMSGRKRWEEAMNVVDRIFMAKCPKLKRYVPVDMAFKCEHADRYDPDTGTTRCTYCGVRDVEFFITCPRFNKETTVKDCSECPYGKVDAEKGTVTCSFIE
jgi:hypothetical protein